MKNAVKLKDNVIRIDPQLLFQRLITAGIRHGSLGEVFKYKLCSFPPSLFEDKCTHRTPNTASLADALWQKMPPDLPEPSGDVQYVLDGGALRHRITWECGSTYDEICRHYVCYVEKHYKRPIVVFDGYLHGPSYSTT